MWSWPKDEWYGWETPYLAPPKKEPWQEWFAWHPVVVNGKRKWLTKVLRKVVMRREDMTLYATYQYGDIFDVIKDVE